MLSPSESVSKSTDTPLDAPPAYDGAGASSSTQPIIEKLSATRPPTFRPLLLHRHANFGAQSRVVSKRTWTNLLGLGSPQRRAAKEVRQTVSGLIHDLVRDQNLDSSGSCVGILESCSEACAAQAINMPDVLQQHYIEAIPRYIYWASLSARSMFPSHRRRQVDAQGYTPACLHNGDQWLYQALRLVPPDTVVVGTPARHDAPFTVEFELAQFQKRMRVAQEVYLEFISHGWSMVVRLGVTEDSPSTFVQAAYVLEEHIPDTLDRSVRLELGLKGEQHVALPDAVQYPRSPFLTADETLRGKLTVQITR
ncbi:hypothetical protein B0H14DRAFT_3879900 [Mycena olivaceomarginata]|nr:hypothetical protein B0H14DRAFT_3879900 [Mycena olivaceomarginata]